MVTQGTTSNAYLILPYLTTTMLMMTSTAAAAAATITTTTTTTTTTSTILLLVLYYYYYFQFLYSHIISHWSRNRNCVSRTSYMHVD